MSGTLIERVSVVVLAALLLSLAGCSNPAGSEIPGWVLAWSDEFDGPMNESPDSTKWGFDIGTNWGNDQLEYDTDRVENVSTDGQGHLAIVARQESYLGREYTSARIVTRGKFEPTYGRIEARIKLPVGQGLWPAFWLLGSDIATVGWPACGEVDIMEYRGQRPQTIHGSLHGPGYSGSGALTARYDLVNDRFDTAFHVFAVEWRRESIKWYVDSVNYHTVRRGEPSGDWVFYRPFYIILNVAVGGNYVGPPDNTTVFPQTMLVDWVRVYRQE